MAFTILDGIIIVLVAFVPSFIYLVWIRNTERFAPEPYGRLLRIFAYGAFVSVMIAIVGELIATSIFNANIKRLYDIFGKNPNLASLALAIVIAPVIEELTKSLGVFRVRRFMSDIEDGMIYGAAVGLGFAATENLLYEGSAFLSGGAEALAITAAVRSLSSALLHASAAAVVGLGIARSHREGRSWLPYYAGGVLMHASFNLFASLGEIYTNQTEAALIGLMAAFVIAIGGITVVRSKIRALDIESARSGSR